MSFLALEERFQEGGSLLHRLEARTKLLITLAFIFAATLTPTGRWEVLGGLAILLAAGVILGTLSPLLVMRRSALALPFVLAAVPLLFTREGDELFTIPVLAWRWTASDAGLEAVLTILLKSWLSVSAAVVLTATTPAADLLRALRGLHVPRLIVTTVSFMYRYIFVIGEEAQRLMRARDSRSAVLGEGSGGSIRPDGRASARWRARVLGNMVGSLFLRSYERAERIYDAMRSRGYDGELRSLAVTSLRRLDYAALTIAFGLLTVLETYARLSGG
jgi:cobalt/nickel transport system permease protein